MALHRYFKISNKLPDPYSPLLKTVPSDAIKEVNKIVERSIQNASTQGSRGTCLKFTSTQQAQVAKYAVENGNQAAITKRNNEQIVDIFLGMWPTTSLPFIIATVN